MQLSELNRFNEKVPFFKKKNKMKYSSLLRLHWNQDQRLCSRFGRNQIKGISFVSIKLLRQDWQLQNDVEGAEQKVELKLNVEAVCECLSPSQLSFRPTGSSLCSPRATHSGGQIL